MRVLIVNKYAKVVSGADRHCVELARALEAAGHSVRFLSADSEAEPSGIVVHSAVRHESRDALRGGARLLPALRGLWNRSAAAAAEHLLTEFRPDVVHAHKLYPQLSVAPLLVARRQGVPIVQTVHDYEFVSAAFQDPTGSAIDRHESRLDYRLLNTVLFQVKRRLHIPAVARWITVSEAVAGRLRSVGIGSEVLPNFTSADPGPVPDRESRTGAVFLGRLTVEKGIPELLGAAAAMPEVPVRIAGSGPLEEEVRRASSELENLDFLGLLGPGQAAAELRRSRCCLMPSTWEEPGALVCLEAMAAGTPVIAFDVGGFAEYVAGAGGGIVVPPAVPSLVAACRRIVQADGEEWASYSQAGLAATREKHSPKRYVQRLERVYAAALEVAAAPTASPA